MFVVVVVVVPKVKLPADIVFLLFFPFAYFIEQFPINHSREKQENQQKTMNGKKCCGGARKREKTTTTRFGLVHVEGVAICLGGGKKARKILLARNPSSSSSSSSPRSKVHLPLFPQEGLSSSSFAPSSSSSSGGGGGGVIQFRLVPVSGAGAALAVLVLLLLHLKTPSLPDAESSRLVREV